MLYYLFPPNVGASHYSQIYCSDDEWRLNVWSQSEYWNHECYPRWLLIWALVHRSWLFSNDTFFFPFYNCAPLVHPQSYYPPAQTLLHELPSALRGPPVLAFCLSLHGTLFE